MPPPGQYAADHQLMEHPFEAIGFSVEQARHYNYVKKFFQTKINDDDIAVIGETPNFIDVHQIFYQRPLCKQMRVLPGLQDTTSPYAAYLSCPPIRKILQEVYNRDLNLLRCHVFKPEVGDPFKEYQVSYLSNDRSGASTKPLPLSLFCAIVSSASRFQTIEELIPQELKHKQVLSKMAQKAKDKEAVFKPAPSDRMKIGDHTERVQRKILGVPVGAWIQLGQRANFISNKRQRIAEEQGRNVDSSDSEDTLGEDDDDLYN